MAFDLPLTTIEAQLGPGASPPRSKVAVNTQGGQTNSAEPPAFGSPEWAKQVGQQIAPHTTKVTTGLAFSSDGQQVARRESGRDNESYRVQEVLSASPQFPKPPGWRPGDTLASAEHVETKIALWMREEEEIQELTLVINNKEVCPPPYGCQVAVRTILRRGTQLNVVSSVSGLVWPLKGVAS